MSLHFNILTLFPEMFPGGLAHGVTGRALEQGLWSLNAVNIRDFSTDNYKTVDDSPFGGGAGMVLKPDILSSAIESLPKRGRMIYLSPRGRVLNQGLARELVTEPCLTLLCGRYEGVDQIYCYRELKNIITILKKFRSATMFFPVVNWPRRSWLIAASA